MAKPRECITEVDHVKNLGVTFSSKSNLDILALVTLNRMRDPIAATMLPESQCGFRRNRITMDMIFAVRQLMLKVREQHRNLYIGTVYFTKWFDSVHALH